MTVEKLGQSFTTPRIIDPKSSRAQVRGSRGPCVWIPKYANPMSSRPIHYLINTRAELVIQLLLIVGFLITALHLRFEIPRYDYWDIAFESTFVFEGEGTALDRLFTYLFSPVADQIMALPKLAILLSNRFAGQYFIAVEIIISWAFLLVGYLCLLSLMRASGSAPIPNAASLNWKRIIICMLYWWPAVLPSLTNNWFALQYSIVLSTGLTSIYFYRNSEGRTDQQVIGFVLFLCCAVSHGTGVMLGPALALWLLIRRERSKITVLVLAFASGLLIVWLWPERISSTTSPENLLWSPTSLKFFVRIGTPFFWEQAIFLLILLPASLIYLIQAANPKSGDQFKDACILVFWVVGVWGVTFVARYKFQDYANPHYLRFFILLYVGLLVTFVGWIKENAKQKMIVLAGILLAIVWLKGVERGLDMAISYRSENMAGRQSLIESMTQENALTQNIYPAHDRRLTGILIPQLLSNEKYPYRKLLDQP